MNNDFEQWKAKQPYLSITDEGIWNAATAKMEQWRRAVIDELVICHIYQAEHENNPRKAIKDAIAWHVEVALDPQVSEGAQALLDKGAAKMEDRVKKLEALADPETLAIVAEHGHQRGVAKMRKQLTAAQAEIARLREALEACRSSVKSNLTHYEKLGRAYENISEEKHKVAAVNAEAARLFQLIEQIDALKTPEPGHYKDQLIEELSTREEVNSCLCCGKAGEPKVWPIGSPSIYVCENCHRKATLIHTKYATEEEGDAYMHGWFDGNEAPKYAPYEEVKQELNYRSIADSVIRNLEGRKQVINLDFEEELLEEIMQEMTDTIREGYRPTTRAELMELVKKVYGSNYAVQLTGETK